ncbi:amidohydrolase family protein [Leucobacter edaphi]|uniref:amidohydrolase family protein n=1 Tax=Leucobacter edaphi TaxID=2796472 RepID=UPI0034E26D29
MTVFDAEAARRSGTTRAVRRMRTDGSFAPAIELPVPAELPGSGELWAVPGLVDAHVHAAWHDFDAADRSARSARETTRLTSAALRTMFAAGFTRVRDAGGLLPGQLAEAAEHAGGSGASPFAARAELSHALLDRAAAAAAGGLDAAVEGVLADGANWVKLVGTAGVAAPAGARLEPVFTAAEVRDAVQRAHAAGAEVMMHAWGGAAIDDAIEAGVRSIEHGMYLSAAQASRAAERGTFFVPTIRIYRLVLAMIDRGELPAAFRPRVADAVAAHPVAVRVARDAGVPIAVGTDSGTPEQHGSGWHELAALVEAGLTPGEALEAATAVGAALLDGPRGGLAADAVLLTRAPDSAEALRDPELVAAVIRGGAPDLITEPTERNPK